MTTLRPVLTTTTLKTLVSRLPVVPVTTKGPLPVPVPTVVFKRRTRPLSWSR